MTSAVPIQDIPAGSPCDEFTFMNALRIAACAPGLFLPLSQARIRLARQNTGSVQTRDRSGRQTGVFRAGPVAGAADLSGMASVVVGGRTLGLRLEVECKGAKTRVTEEQEAYLRFVNSFGGVALLARYSGELSLSENVAAALAEIDRAVADRTLLTNKT